MNSNVLRISICGTTSAGWLLSLCKFQTDDSDSLACSEFLIG
jgi:hypothetical protein